MGNKMSESTCLDLAIAKPNMIIKSNIAQYNPSKNLASKKFNHLKLPKIVRTV